MMLIGLRRLRKILSVLSLFCYGSGAFAEEIVASVPSGDKILAALPQSGYTLEKAAAKGDTTITLYETAADGTLTPVYYNVKLKQTAYGTGDTTLTYGWEKNAIGRLEFKQDPATHVGQLITYTYDATKTQNARKDNTADLAGNTIEGIFKEQKVETSGTAYGGAIYNHNSSAKLGDINADFIKNFANSQSQVAAGGAIYNYYGNIGNITGDFVGNYAYSSSNDGWGGAILNWNGTIGNINGNFIGNYLNSDKTAKGGVIHNDVANIEIIAGDFIGNNASGQQAYGGVIYNKDAGTINGISGHFIGNYAVASNAVLGGAIYNDTGNIQKITGNFIGNYASGSSSTYGGAIYNYNNNKSNSINSTIGEIAGSFVGNHVNSASAVMGGAILNWTEKNSQNRAVIGDIDGDFTGNYIVSTNSVAKGGAIHNDKSSIGNIKGKFEGNYASGSSFTYGGAIYSIEKANIGNIKGDFSSNSAVSTSSTAAGGAIYNDASALNKKVATIGKIEGSFKGNYASSTNGAVWGGAILNWYGTIDDIGGDFTGNYIASTKNAAKGGAIHNDASEIGNITGNFDGNSASGASAYGGAIYNKDKGSIKVIEGNFANNYASSTNGEVLGGAIYNYNRSTIDKVTGNFSGNSAVATNGVVKGGAIYNDNNSTIGDISGSFTGNHADTTSTSELALGGAVYTHANMNFIADNKNIEFTGNYTNDSRGKINNAIFVDTGSSSALTIGLKAQNNGTITFNDQIDGGAVSDTNTTIDKTNTYNLNLTGDATGKIALNDKIINAKTTHDSVTLKIGNADTFKDSTLTTNSGIIDTKDGEYTNYNIKELTSSENTRYNIDISLSKDEQKADTFTLANGGTGTIYLSSINVNNNSGYNEKYILQIIKSETDNAPELEYDSSKVLQWATPNMTSDTIIAADFGLTTTKTHNDSLIISGLLDAFPEWAELQTDEAKSFTFIDNSEYTLSRDITALNGTDLTVNGANNTLNLNNKNIFSDIKDTQKVSLNNMTVTNAAITNNGTFNLDTITLDDSVKVNNNNIINISGDMTINADIAGSNGKMNINGGETTLNAAVSNQAISSDNATINLNNVATFNNNSFNLVGSNLNIQNLASNKLHLNSLKLSDTNISIGNIDVDLINKSMGKIQADTYGDVAGKIDVQNLTLLNDARTGKTDVFFADAELADVVTYSGSKTIAYSPIYKYDVSYNKNPNDNRGYFSFVRPGFSSGNPSDSFNPSILSVPVALQAGAYAAQLQLFNYAFEHADTFMKLPYHERMTVENYSRCASSMNYVAGWGASPCYNRARGERVWVKPYATFEHVSLKNGPKVSSDIYGTLVGIDSDIKTIKYDIDRVITAYVGYHGSKQEFSNVDISQNGGLAGSTVTLYKDNFFNATTVSAGVSSGKSDTMFGEENFTLLSAGIGNKTGYNFEFNEGRVILQPNFLMSYTYIGSFDYTNAAGLRIKSDALNAIQLAPGVKLIGNTENGWQPYAGVSMVWNLHDESKVKAEDVRLPEMSIDPYVQYGLGIQKNYDDEFLVSGQAMIHSGGRNGVELTVDFNWAFD